MGGGAGFFLLDFIIFGGYFIFRYCWGEAVLPENFLVPPHIISKCACYRQIGTFRQLGVESDSRCFFVKRKYYPFSFKKKIARYAFIYIDI